jgi:hypothetical protein
VVALYDGVVAREHLTRGGYPTRLADNHTIGFEVCNNLRREERTKSIYHST